MKNLVITPVGGERRGDCVPGFSCRTRPAWVSPDGTVRMESKSLPLLVAAIVADRKAAR